MVRAAPLLLLASLLAAGCARPPFDPARSTRPYPAERGRAAMADVQVFREGVHVDLVNATPRTYDDVTLWVNRRYALDGATLPAGRTTRLSLWDFYDVRGEVFNAGGFFRTREPTPVRLVEIEPGEDAALIGLVTIRAERADD